MSSKDLQAIEAARLYGADKSFGQIAEELQISRSHAQTLTRRGLNLALNEMGKGDTSELTEENPGAHQNLEDGAIIPVKNVVPALNSLRDFGMEQSEVELALGRTFIEQSLPIMRKIMLSPKIYLLYDYCKDKLEFQGDIGDFLADCVDFFFRANGFEISITHKSEILA